MSSRLPWRLSRALRPFQRLQREAGRARAAGGLAGVAGYLAERARMLALGATGRGQSEEELARVSMRYWNQGDQAGIDLKDYSHWAGAGPWQDREKWLALGRVHYEMYEQLCRYTGMPRPIQSAVEWGSGGGANAIHFIREVRQFCGVEISQASLDECGRVLLEAGFDGFQPVHIPAEEPEKALGLAPGPFDFFLSAYVYELLPGRAYGERVTRIAWQLLRPGGLALIQIRYDDGSERSTQKNADYFRNSTRFTSYRVEEFWLLAERAGFVPLYVTLVPRKTAGFSGDLYAYFALSKPGAVPGP